MRNYNSTIFSLFFITKTLRELEIEIRLEFLFLALWGGPYQARRQVDRVNWTYLVQIVSEASKVQHVFHFTQPSRHRFKLHCLLMQVQQNYFFWPFFCLDFARAWIFCWGHDLHQPYSLRKEKSWDTSFMTAQVGEMFLRHNKDYWNESIYTALSMIWRVSPFLWSCSNPILQEKELWTEKLRPC